MSKQFYLHNSIRQRATIYQNAEVAKVGFWRLGQEDPSIWSAYTIGALLFPIPTPVP